MKKYYFIVLFLVIIFLVIPKSIFSDNDGDWQYWNTESIDWKIIDVKKDYLDTVEAKVETEFRWGDNVGELYYYHGDFGISFNKLFEKWFSFGLNYRQVYELKDSDWVVEHRPYINGTIKINLGEWELSNRSRFEYRDTETYNAWRYRNLTALIFPWKFTSWNIRPYVADEIFYDFHVDELNRNRLYAGFKIGKIFLLECLKGDIYLLWQSKKKPDWGDEDYYISGTKLRVHF